MIDKLYYFISPGYNPHENIATEEELLYRVNQGECILYLWQNERTVVIGRNQNAWKECRIEQLSCDDGVLARRLSGGGAVYHDLGNLNFTFLLRKKDYDTVRQSEVILRAVQNCGIQAIRNGRNDLTVDDKKFSGNAYYETGDRLYHHGTVMVNVSKADMKKYLRPSSFKLKSKGVSSVESRVMNLCEAGPDITVEKLRESLLESFRECYNLPAAEELFVEDMDIASLLKRRKKFGTVVWVYGKASEFTNQFNFRGEYGEIYIEMKVDCGKIISAKVYSDSMDIMLPGKIEKELTGLLYDSSETEEILKKYGKV